MEEREFGVVFVVVVVAVELEERIRRGMCWEVLLTLPRPLLTLLLMLALGRRVVTLLKDLLGLLGW